MTDDLLDEATRVADAYQREIPSGISPIADLLRALVERVQAAEADAISLRSIVTNEMQMREDAERRAAVEGRRLATSNRRIGELSAERDHWKKAWGGWADSAVNSGIDLAMAQRKLDAVRAHCQANIGNCGGDDEARGTDWALRDVLAILDGKAPVRPVDSRSATPGVPGPDAP